MMVREFLFANQDLKYKEFSLKLNISKKREIIGVRLPIIQKYAKTLLKEYPIDYLINNINEDYYEEVLLKGFIIGSSKLSFDELTKYLDYYIPLIDDWSMNDTFAASLKITKKYQDELWLYLKKKLKSKKEFVVRFALVMILNYYLTDKYKRQIYQVILNTNLDKYYVKMANAWLLSYMIIKYFDETMTFLDNNNLDPWIVKKGLVKAIESRRIDNNKKEIIKKRVLLMK